MWARREEESVWEHTLTTSAKAHGLLAPAPQGWPHTPHLRRRIGSMGLWIRFSPLAPCRWGVCGQSILIFRRDRALVRRKRKRPVPSIGAGRRIFELSQFARTVTYHWPLVTLREGTMQVTYGGVLNIIDTVAEVDVTGC